MSNTEVGYDPHTTVPPACAAGLTGVFTDTVLGAVGAAIGGGIAGLWRKKRKGRKY